MAVLDATHNVRSEALFSIASRTLTSIMLNPTPLPNGTTSSLPYSYVICAKKSVLFHVTERHWQAKRI
jgi:hypothetical protein